MITIRLDSREASTNKGLKNSLQKIDDIIFEVEQINIGDILVGKYLIERKSVKDLLTRNEDGSLHIFDQLDRLVDKEKEGFIPIILINGLFHDAWKRYTIRKQNMIRSQISGLINSIIFKYGFIVIKLDDERQIINWIKNLIKRAKDPSKKQLRTLRTHPRRELSADDKSLYILQGYKYIGPAKSKKILEKFESIDNLIFLLNYDDDIEFWRKEFEKIVGFKALEEFLIVNDHTYGYDK